MKKQSILNLLILLIAISPLVYLFIVWDAIPLSFVARFEFEQAFEKVQTRQELLIATIVLSGVSALLYLLLRNLKKIDPKVTDETPRSSFHKLGLIITLFLVILNYFLILSAKNDWTVNTKVAIGFSGLFVMLIGNYMHNIKPNYIAGIRLPWTLNDPDNWRRTHLLAGKLWFAAGLLLIISSFFLPGSLLIPAMITVIIVVTLIPGIYSYKLYRSKLPVLLFLLATLCGHAQTTPPPYFAEDLVYHNQNNTISYGATITIPGGKGPFPAVLLLTGSGQQNRDEEMVGHKPFAVLADHLTRNGYVVLRVDDRGTGQTTGDVVSATSRDFANDATVSFEYLKSRKEVNKKKMGLIGHSEGGMIAQIMAAERSDIDFVILLAGPGEKTLKVMSDQNESILLKSGMPANYVTAYVALYNQVLATILSSDTISQKEKVQSIVDTWIANTPDSIVIATTRIKDETSKNNFVNLCVSQLSIPWVKYFFAYDPAINLQRMRAKVLALNGSMDVQVAAKTNLSAIEEALKNGQSKNYEVKELPGLNHLFQECTSCTVAEYGKIEQAISPVVLQTITVWMKKNL